MRSRSRERRPFGREDVRDRRRDFHGDERSRGKYESRHSRSRSPGRSRSRDRVKPRARNIGLDGTRELREVKRILVNDVAPRRDTERVSINDKIRDGTAKESRKIFYNDYRASERSRNDDEFKTKKVRYGEVSRTENPKPAATSSANDKDTNSKSNEAKLANYSTEKQKADEQYDEKDLKEIEQFLAKANGSTNLNTSNKIDIKDDVAEGSGEEDVLLWEDEEDKARREAAEAEERRKRRQEIASKYEPTSPKAAKTALGSSPRQLLSPKQHSVPIIDSDVVGTDPANGGSSISIPTTMHLAKLALDGEQSEAPADPLNIADQSPLMGNAVAAATKKVLPYSKNSTEDEAAAAGAVVVELDSEGRQLEAERSAVEQEERIERSKTGTGTGGFGGGYGAGGRVEFDMFSSSPSGIDHQFGRKGYLGANGKYGDTGIGGRRALREALLDGEGTHGVLEGEDPHLQSNWDDGEGYYKARIGELVGERFQILGVVGKGVFSTVLKCVDLRAGDGTTNVAVKMIRNNDTMRKAAEKEKSILLSIAEHDPENKKFCVRLLTHLEYRNHVALVFEYQSMNLRETLKKFGKDVGINIGAVRMYGRQLFVALKHLMDLGVVHADIKLDNILCSADLKQVKLCDFGSAFRETDTDNDPTPYLVSRFYRAPEIILGLQYDRAIDLWAVCASLYELFTGHVMFPGRTNNEMLRLMMAVKGRFPNKQVKAHMRSYEVLSLEPHFDPDLRFRQYEADPITGKTILRLMEITNPTRDLAATLRSSKAGADDMKLVTAFTDLLERGLSLDPAKRLTVVEAFRHHFLSSK